MTRSKAPSVSVLSSVEEALSGLTHPNARRVSAREMSASWPSPAPTQMSQQWTLSSPQEAGKVTAIQQSPRSGKGDRHPATRLLCSVPLYAAMPHPRGRCIVSWTCSGCPSLPPSRTRVSPELLSLSWPSHLTGHVSTDGGTPLLPLVLHASQNSACRWRALEDGEGGERVRGG